MTNSDPLRSISITNYANVAGKMDDLGCVYPSSGITLLPINFDVANSISDLRHASLTSTTRKMLLQDGLPLSDILERGQRPPYVKNKSSTLVFPILFLSASFLSENPTLVTVAVNIFSNYVYEALRFIRPKPTASLKIVVEKKKGEEYKCISYDGSDDGVKALIDVIREVVK